MTSLTQVAIFCVCIAGAMAGCGKPTNRTVADGIDKDAIKAYEASMAALEGSQTNMDIDGKDDADPIRPRDDLVMMGCLVHFKESDHFPNSMARRHFRLRTKNKVMPFH
ncbi:hypothetical protein Poly51_12030 [Rubripirellula tenax]|uniref:Uncharacterized protein n=1 Tax=Rubripirellula tenax TaxID=2528015 RepID=A0A5C6FAD8_9BACT|nr:hypothetical protein [Rubripirellula tenax]TWU58425.1 hypothetical protein Poly51_12030 [Rubripirellula tenax]